MKIPLEWSDVCGPQGLQPWNDDSKDFGQCFQELCLQLPVYLVIAILSGYYVGYRRDWVIRDKNQERVIVFRSLVVLALVVIPIVEMYVLVTRGDSVVYPVRYLSSSASCLAWLVHFCYVLALKQRLGPSPRGPACMVVAWGAALTLSVVALRTAIVSEARGFHVGIVCCHALYLVSLVPARESRRTYYSAGLVGSQHAHSEYSRLLPDVEEEELGEAGTGVGWLARLTFSWLHPLLHKGTEEQLHDLNDLFEVPGPARAPRVAARLLRALGAPPRATEPPGYGATERVAPPAEPQGHVSLLRALHTCFALRFYGIGLLRLASDVAGLAGPVLLNYLVRFVQERRADGRAGYACAAALALVLGAGALCGAHFSWRMALLGVEMRAALVAVLQRKVLALSPARLLQRFTLGEVTNFMSTDTERVVNSCPSFHALWSIPLQLFVTLFLLYNQVGVSFLAGVGFSVVLIPINKVVADRIGSLSFDMMQHKDARVGLVADVLRGIRHVKLHVWEDYFIQRINEARGRELRYLRARKMLDALCVLLWATTPVLVAALTLGVHALRGRPLDAPTVFTTVALVNMLIAPLNAFPWVLNGLAEAWVSLRRIQQLLDLPDMDMESYYDRVNKNYDEDKVIIFKNATFSWNRPSKGLTPQEVIESDKAHSTKNVGNIQRRDSMSSSEASALVEEEAGREAEAFWLREVSVCVSRGELLGVTGAVGSGKSSLLRALLGDMRRNAGSLQLAHDVHGFGYVPQRAWLVRGSIRDNILFGKPYDEAKFRSVVDACALTEDLNVLGWNAQVGEGGQALSGGQRARVALARAVYQDKQVYVLDEPLAGSDARVAQHILQRCVHGLLRHTTRVLAAHDASHLARADRVLLLHEGRVLRQGPPHHVLRHMEDEPGPAPQAPPAQPDLEPQNQHDDDVSRNSLDGEETMSEGTVDWSVILLYLRSVGPVLVTSILLSLVLMQVSQNMTFLWLTYWVRQQEQNATAPQLDATPSSRSDRFFLEVYFALAGLNLLFTTVRAFLFAHGGVKAASRIHKVLLKVIVKAKVKFFDATPAGRIVNRFSSDTYTVDDSLPFILNILLAQLCSLAGALVVCVYALPWLALGVALLAAAWWRLQRVYRRTSRQLKRLQSVALSPVYSHLADTLDGLDVVRALGAAPAWAAHGAVLVADWQRAALCSAAASAWLGLRVAGAGALVAGTAGALGVLQRTLHGSDPGLVGLAVSYALSLSSLLGGVLNAFTETERELIAVERVAEYVTQVECEEVDGESPPYGWPSQGVIEFDDVHLKYSEREGAPAALDGLTFTTRPGERLAVLGRTGAGKSSLLAVLLRLVRPQRGHVRIDGVDVGALQLHALRSRLAVIPQEPFLFVGSVLDNVDPLRQYGEEQVWRAMDALGCTDGVRALGGLHAACGARVSRGLAQQLCAARALLRRARVLLLDEATAALDVHAERRLLRALHALPATQLHVAHRAAAALHAARVLVLGGGRVLELRPTDEALADAGSQLNALLHAR